MNNIISSKYHIIIFIAVDNAVMFLTHHSIQEDIVTVNNTEIDKLKKKIRRYLVSSSSSSSSSRYV
jgi:hypothetical protein